MANKENLVYLVAMEREERGERMVLLESLEKREFEVRLDRKEKLDQQG